MNTVYADISENGKRVDIYFSYSRETYLVIKGVSGSRFVPPDKGGPFWHVPLEYEVVRQLKKACGENIVIGDDLLAWGRREKAKSNQLQLLSSATDAKLKRLPEVLPDLYEWLRPYQRSGAAFIAAAGGCVVADQPGLGKTVEVIAGIYEAGLENGAHLVVCPKVSMESVWKYELERWQPLPVWVPTGTRKQRERVVEDFYHYVVELGEPGWLVCNPQMVAYRREAPVCQTCGTVMTKLKKTGEDYYCPNDMEQGKAVLYQVYEEIGAIEWETATIDECHKNAIRNSGTLTARAMLDLDADKRTAMSGTPIANRPKDLWGILHWAEPEKHPAKWRWFYQWLEVEDNGYGKKVGNVREDRKEDFFRSLTPYMLRRTRGEVFSELPPAQPVDIWVDMTPAQEKQYLQFAEMAEVKIEEEKLVGTERLTEYLRLKQFAISKQRLERVTKKGEEVLTPFPTMDSGKLEALEELLEERGIFEEGSDQKVVIGSQWERVVTMLMEWLEQKGVPAIRLTGKENRKQGEAKRIQDKFQAPDGPRVIVMTIETGGVSITLDRADTCICIDETWLASDMEQFVDRLRPQGPSRMDRPESRVFVYYIRTKKTIDEYIFETVYMKGEEAGEILDGRRKLKLY